MTERIYHYDSYVKRCEAKVLDVRRTDSGIEILLDRTILYPGGGGQPADFGIIWGEGFEIGVIASREEGDDVWHIGSLKGKVPNRGEEVLVSLDWDRRYENMVQHTAQHILSAAILKLRGADTQGFQIFEEKSKIEIELQDLSWKDIVEFEIEANSQAKRCLEIKVDTMDTDKNLRKISKKVLGEMRVIRIGDYDSTACGGTHVKNSVEVLPIKITNFYRKTSKIWRIEFVAGDRAIRTLNRFLEDYWKSMKTVGRKEPPLNERIREKISEYEKMLDEERVWKKRYGKLFREYIPKISHKVGKYTVAFYEGISVKDADKFVDEEIDVDFIVIISEKTFALYSRKKMAGKLLECLKRKMNVRGGGGDFSAKGRVEDVEKFREEIINCIREL